MSEAVPFADPDPYDDLALRQRRDKYITHGMHSLHVEKAELLNDLVTYAYPAPITPGMAQSLEDHLDTLTKRRATEQAMADRFERHPDSNIRSAGGKMRECHAHGDVHGETDTRGDFLSHGRRRVLWTHKCNQSRVCPHAARAAAQKFIEQTTPAMQLLRFACNAKLQYWVLSPPNVPRGSLAEAKKKLWEKVAELLKWLRAKRLLLGAFVVLEDPLGKDGDWNVHFNVLALTAGPFVPWREIRERLGWMCHFAHERRMVQKTTERMKRLGRWHPDVTGAEILKTALQEVIKYAAKITGSPEKKAHADGLPAEEGGGDSPGLVDYDDDELSEWFHAQPGTRRVRAYGWLNGQCKFSADDLVRYPKLRPFEAWVFDASALVQGQRIKFHREARGWSRQELAARWSRQKLAPSEFRALVRLTSLEPADRGRKGAGTPAREPLGSTEAQTLARTLGVAPGVLTRLQGVSAVGIARRMTEKPEAAGWKRAGIVRWHKQEQRYRALYLIQAAKSEVGEPDWSTPPGPPPPPKGPGPPLSSGTGERQPGTRRVS